MQLDKTALREDKRKAESSRQTKRSAISEVKKEETEK